MGLRAFPALYEEGQAWHADTDDQPRISYAYKAFRHVETLFYQAGLLLASRFVYLPPTNIRPAWYKVSTLDE